MSCIWSSLSQVRGCCAACWLPKGARSAGVMSAIDAENGDRSDLAQAQYIEAWAGHRIYPYLLRGLMIDQPNHVWATDITYIPMARGFVYLAAVMDWFTRRILAWRLSNTMEASFCIDAVD